MKKRVKELVISIIISILLIVVSIPVWNRLDNKRNDMLATDINKDYKIEVLVNQFPVVVLVEDTKAMDKIEPTIISLRNRNSEDKDYNLYFFVDKKSTVDPSYIRVSIDSTIYKTEYLDMYETDEGYYYKLISDKLIMYEEKPIDVRIWITKDAKNVVKNNSILITNFVTEI